MTQAPCRYCTASLAELDSLMVHVADLDRSRAFLLRDQTHRGRCVLLLKQHARELFELAPEDLRIFMAEAAQLAAAIAQLGDCDKVNYAIYGDLNEHVHLHLVPKTRGGSNWGQAFVLVQDQPVTLPQAEFNATLQKLQLLLQVT
ncbi:MAG: HIT domain-containing protein [Rhodoferax sp.]|uniref:HIT family protein n=1 Tax=Rhodoferax sp. TaxID=50421 RepID=UPI0032635581